VDRRQLSAIVDAISRLLVDDEEVLEIDCNPILVRDGRPLVADALVVKR
jgi:acetyl-CoA synthetase (ADP-forming)